MARVFYSQRVLSSLQDYCLASPVFALFTFLLNKHCQSMFFIKPNAEITMACVLARTVANDATLTMLPPQGPCRYKPIKLLQKNNLVFCCCFNFCFVLNCGFSNCYNLIVSHADFSPSVIFCSSLYSPDYQMALPLSKL